MWKLYDKNVGANVSMNWFYYVMFQRRKASWISAIGRQAVQVDGARLGLVLSLCFSPGKIYLSQMLHCGGRWNNFNWQIRCGASLWTHCGVPVAISFQLQGRSNLILSNSACEMLTCANFRCVYEWSRKLLGGSKEAELRRLKLSQVGIIFLKRP